MSISDKKGEPHLITINCIDRLHLACNVAKVLFEFSLNVVQADFSTDGKWCLLLFWVTPSLGFITQSIKWGLLKDRLISECPSSSLLTQFSSNSYTDKKKIYLLKTCSVDRVGLLNDIVHALWQLELEVLKVNALTSPNGSAVNIFFLRDIRSELQDDKRQEAICKQVELILGASHSFCELSLAIADDLNETFDVEGLHSIPDVLLRMGHLSSHDVAGAYAAPHASKFSLNIDNSLSRGHTLLQITSRDRKGLLYDCLRASGDLNLQIAYGRLTTTPKGCGAFELFVSQANMTKLVDLDKQKSLQTRLELNICEPVRVMIVDGGVNAELLVVMTVEMCGWSRPCILNDITWALRTLQVGIFKASNEKICQGDQIWELYRFLFIDRPGSLLSKQEGSCMIERVKSVLIG